VLRSHLSRATHVSSDRLTYRRLNVNNVLQRGTNLLLKGLAGGQGGGSVPAGLSVERAALYAVFSEPLRGGHYPLAASTALVA
jgi:hypothetical protein